MHSSRMCTAHSSSRLLGGLPQCMLGYPPAWAWRSPQVWACRPPWVWAPQARSLNFPLGFGPETCRECWDTTYPPLETCKACWDTTYPPLGDLQGMLGYHLQCMLGYHPSPVNRMTDRCKNITLPQTLFAGGNKNAFQ